MLDTLEEGIEHLRTEYQKYFLGVERHAPVKLHKKVERLLRDAEATRPRATVLRFRLGGLRSRFVTYNHYWTRVLHQIETGTYRRDRDLAQRRVAARAAAEASESAAEAAPESDAETPAPPPPPAGSKRAAPPPLPSGVPGMDAGAVRKLYEDLVAAKRAAGEKTDGLTYNALVRKLAREAPKLQERHGGKSVRFEVAEVGGKVTLRARTGR
jgi:hypothetical protein